MSDKTNIFASEHNESPAQVIRQTMAVSLSDDGEAVISFATNRGKGSGAQVLPVGEFREYVETLEGYSKDGIPETGEEELLSAAETVRRTIKQDDGMISFRVRSGKGAKPAKVSSGDFGEVVELLRGTVDAVEQAGQSLAPESDEE
ncbi:MAG: hypothetical protein QF662_07020 [Phycisphaerae bacterium]|nr:hypothetical protein [Candidatus Pacearchaeota archaeon]MDP6381080.1 hypothetical protein [Phycisphaerae bacterium]|tara:strand:- start:24 stop:461 length:438 start_codon:yes stop_codon:yes gene_type:complete